MARKKYLPKYVSSFTSHSGRTRLRYRRKGFLSHYFIAPLGTEDFRIEYRLCEDSAKPSVSIPSAYVSGSVHDLVSRYCATPSRLGPSLATQAKIRNILDRFRLEHGHRLIADLRFEHVDRILAKRMQKVLVNKRMEGGTEAAKKLRKELVRLFAFAVKIRLLKTNPIVDSDRIKVSVGARSTGYYSWTEHDIIQYRDRHPLGSRPRLAMELMLWTGQRRADAIRYAPGAVVDGRIEMTQGKTGKGLGLAVATQLREAIDAMPPLPVNAKAYLLTEAGQPFSNAGFGNWFRDQCDLAGLPQCTAHGLRKAIMRRMAELNMSNQSLKSVSGHSRDEEVALYTRAANQRSMADSAIARLSEWEVSHRLKNGDTSHPKIPENQG